TLGRMLASRWNIGAIQQAMHIPHVETSADEFVSRLLAILARSVPPGSPSDHEALAAGVAIDPASFAELTNIDRDALSLAYLHAEPSWMGPAPVAPPTTPLSQERPTQRLHRLVRGSIQEYRKEDERLSRLLSKSSISLPLQMSLRRSTRLAQEFANLSSLTPL